MDMQILKRNLTVRITKGIDNAVDTVADKIQKAFLSTVNHDITPRIEVAVRSRNACFGFDVANAMASSECDEQTGVAISFESAADRNDTFH